MRKLICQEQCYIAKIYLPVSGSNGEKKDSCSDGQEYPNLVKNTHEHCMSCVWFTEKVQTTLTKIRL